MQGKRNVSTVPPDIITQKKFMTHRLGFIALATGTIALVSQTIITSLVLCLLCSGLTISY